MTNFDDVNGQIIGRVSFMGKLYYHGRAQTQSFFAETHDALRIIADQKIAEKKLENGDLYKVFWPDTDAWELRIY